MVKVRIGERIRRDLNIGDYKVYIKGDALDRSFVVHWNGVNSWFDKKDEETLREHFTDEVVAKILDTITERLKRRANRRGILIP